VKISRKYTLICIHLVKNRKIQNKQKKEWKRRKEKLKYVICTKEKYSFSKTNKKASFSA
jgi:hypothetical protein